jgi:hypothetical protein
MKLFGAQREPADENAGLLQTRWFRQLLTLCGVLLVIAACTEIGRRAMNLGTKVVEAQPVEARIEIMNPPAWLDRRIVETLLQKAYQFAQRDEETYGRARNILDKDVLREIADLYTGTHTVDGRTVSRQAEGFSAWIKRVTEVRRNVAADKSVQTIEIYAQWRAPAAWVRSGDMLYLIDSEDVRLPGDYPLGDRTRSKLLVISGMDLPVVDGKAAAPQPGEVWASGATHRAGEDLLAGMRLVKALQDQPFAHQIDAIDVSNFNGRKDSRAPWILLETVWKKADGSPRVIQWGRPPGEEKYYEVHADAKVKVLNDLYLRFTRIDADRDYVDIRTEFVRLPKLASQADNPAPPGARG